jgi:hypothetical protein
VFLCCLTSQDPASRIKWEERWAEMNDFETTSTMLLSNQLLWSGLVPTKIRKTSKHSSLGHAKQSWCHSIFSTEIVCVAHLGALVSLRERAPDKKSWISPNWRRIDILQQDIWSRRPRYTAEGILALTLRCISRIPWSTGSICWTLLSAKTSTLESCPCKARPVSKWDTQAISTNYTKRASYTTNKLPRKSRKKPARRGNPCIENYLLKPWACSKLKSQFQLRERGRHQAARKNPEVLNPWWWREHFLSNIWLMWPRLDHLLQKQIKFLFWISRLHLEEC